jgi:hypothetical protein
VSESILIGVLLISFLTIAILGGLVVKQKQTIADFKHPKYGFLGKRLSIYILSVCAFGIFSIALYPKESAIDTSVSVSDISQNVEIEIVHNLVSLNEQTYQLTAVPKINGIDWEDKNSIFEITWNVNSKISTEYVSKKDPGGLYVRLDSGVNKISASVNYKGEVFIESIEIEL